MFCYLLVGVPVHRKKQPAFVHSGRKTIHTAWTIFVVVFVCFLLRFFLLPRLLINSITYVEHQRKKHAHTHTQTLIHVALCSLFFIVQHHHRAISFSHARNYELWVWVYIFVLFAVLVSHKFIYYERPNLLCNSVNALNSSVGRSVGRFCSFI